MYLLSIFCLSTLAVLTLGSTKSKPHGHQGVLDAYDGNLIPMNLTPEQLKKLDKGDSVSFNERIGKSGRGVVVQDINASIPICMEKIRDLKAYPKMVPHVKTVDIYEGETFKNGTSRTGAKFDVGVMGMRFGYFLLLTHEPKYNTLTWTLDYKYNSDFDDNVGHWQVMPHPSKKGWSRVLYSTKVKLFSWIPEFVVNFLTGKALVESTTWLKRESEQEAARRGSTPSPSGGWFVNGGALGKLREKLESAKSAADEARKGFDQDNFFSRLAPKFRFGKGV